MVHTGRMGRLNKADLPVTVRNDDLTSLQFHQEVAVSSTAVFEVFR